MKKYKRIFVVGLLLCVCFLVFIAVDNKNTLAPSNRSTASPVLMMEESTLEESSTDALDIQIPETAL